jgi:hypothetical protein
VQVIVALGWWLKAVEHLPSKCEALSSNPSTTHTKKKLVMLATGSFGAGSCVLHCFFPLKHLCTCNGSWVHGFCLSPRVNCFSREHWFPKLEKRVRNSGLIMGYAYCYLLSSADRARKYMHVYKPMYTHVCISLCVHTDTCNHCSAPESSLAPLLLLLSLTVSLTVRKLLWALGVHLTGHLAGTGSAGHAHLLRAHSHGSMAPCLCCP